MSKRYLLARCKHTHTKELDDANRNIALWIHSSLQWNVDIIWD